MAVLNTENFKTFERLVSETGDTYAFNGETSIVGLETVFDIVRDMGLNPAKTDEFKKGLYALFNIQIVNMPDLDNNRFILTPNHVSDFDAIVLGLLHPKIRIVSKTDWVNNERLKPFLDLHYNLYGLDRASLKSLQKLLKDSIEYFGSSNENRHFLIFSQGTISDFNNNGVGRISTAAQKISAKANVPIVNMFVEQVSIYHTTRIVFDTPMTMSKEDDFRAVWLEREKALQSSLTPPARLPVLSHKHANNNNPGDPFF